MSEIMQQIDLDSIMHKPVGQLTPEIVSQKIEALPESEFTPLNISFAHTGIQSFVELGNVGNTPAIRKISGTQMETGDLEKMAHALLINRALLNTHKVPIPHNFQIEVNGGLVVTDEFIKGLDLDVMAQIGHEEMTDSWSKLTKLLCSLNSGRNESRVMIDAKPGNFVRSDEELVFIDFFPPTYRDKDGQIAPFFPELYKRSKLLFTFNYGDTRGQITKLLAGARLNYKKHYPELRDAVLEAITGSLPADIEDYIRDQVANDFPDMTLFYTDEIKGEERLKELL